MCSMTTTKAPPEWTKTLKVNGRIVTAVLDTGCTKSLVHPKYVEEADYLGWNIPLQHCFKQNDLLPSSQSNYGTGREENEYCGRSVQTPK